MRSEITTFLRWVEALPDELVRARPSLSLYHAWALLLAARPLDDVLARLRHGDQAAMRCRANGHPACLPGGLPGAGPRRRLSRLADELLPEAPFLRCLVAWYLGFSHLWHGDFGAASQALERADPTGPGNGQRDDRRHRPVPPRRAAPAPGRATGGEALYEQASGTGRGQRGSTASPSPAWPSSAWANWPGSGTNLERAVRLLQEGIELSKQWGELGTLDGYIALARVRQAQGDAGAQTRR